MNFNDKQKKKILSKLGHEPMRGWCFDFEMPEDACNTFITEEELIKKLREGSKEYYWEENTQVMVDLDDMFERIYEDLYDEKNFEKEAEVDAFLYENHIKGTKFENKDGTKR